MPLHDLIMTDGGVCADTTKGYNVSLGSDHELLKLGTQTCVWRAGMGRLLVARATCMQFKCLRGCCNSASSVLTAGPCGASGGCFRRCLTA